MEDPPEIARDENAICKSTTGSLVPHVIEDDRRTCVFAKCMLMSPESIRPP